MNLLAKITWGMFDIWNNSKKQTSYVKRSALRLKTKALVAEDNNERKRVQSWV